MAKRRRLRHVSHGMTEVRSDSRDVRLDFACLMLVLASASVLILSNLGDVYLWGDEAATALISRTILAHGLPMGWDGRNYFSQLSGIECTKNLVWLWHPWLPFYVLAGFFALFGVDTFTARLPFALFGIMTVVLAFYFGRSLWKSRMAGVFSAGLLLVSVPFLVLVRNCRYYSPEILFSLLGLYGYHMILERRKLGPVVLAVSAFCLFHTHYVQCAVLLGAATTHSLVFSRDRLKPVLVISGVVAALNIPWIIAFWRMWQVTAGYGSLPARTVSTAGTYCGEIGRNVFHPALLLIPAFTAAAYRYRNGRLPVINQETAHKVWLLVMFVVLTVAAASVTGQDVFFRYIGPVIPASCLLAGLMLSSTGRARVLVGVIVLAASAYWMRMPDYLYEITHEYAGPSQGIAKYLNEHGSDSDIVACNHEDLPIKFYTNMRVVAGVTGEPWSAARDADWVILHVYASSKERRFTQYLIQDMRRRVYERIPLDCPDLPFENREEPGLHCFRTVTKAPPVVIFRRVRE